MLRKPASMLLLSLLAISALALAYSIQPVGASGTIYIRADGSIDPLTAPIFTADNITYTMTGDITSGGDGIVVQRDNIILNGAGHTVQGTESGTGISLTGRTNAIVQDTTIKTFANGIVLYYSSNNSIAENTVTANGYDGIVLGYSSNNSIAGNTIARNSHDGIELDHSSDNSIAGNTITANSFHGTWLYFSSDDSIAGNNITNNDYGIYLYSSTNINIAGNNITNNDYGIYLGSSSNYNSIAENSITANNFDGLHLVSSSNSSIAKNSITANNFDGIYLYSSSNSSIAKNSITANNWYGVDLDYSSSNSIAENNITANNQYGVYLYSSSNNSIIGGNITNNRYGFYLDSSSSNSIAGNNITDNGGGLLLESSSSNSIYHNNFVNNTVQAIIPMTASNAWDSGYPSGGNYWGDYTGVDLYSGPYQNETGSDGIGDTPYVIDASNGDNYPLMNPWVPYENGTIYIRADGSVYPSATPILRKGDLYSLTSNINSNADGIMIERDNILVDGSGYTLQGTQASNSTGIELTGRNSVTIKNIKITTFWYGIVLDSSFNDSVSGNNITNNRYGVHLYSSSNNSIAGNSVITNNYVGIMLDSSSNNSVSGNNITANNEYGLWLDSSSNNKIHHNNLNNTGQVHSNDSTNVWDDGYPPGGNYWSDYTGVDLYSGPYQNETGSDGIGDTPYVIDASNQDNYPLMKPYLAYDVALTGLTSAPTVICQGYGCLITVKVANQGDFVETTVTVYANMTDNGNVTVIHTFENVILTRRDSTMLTFMWDTSGFDLGNYTISAYAAPVVGETYEADNTFVGNSIQIVAGMTSGGGGRMPYAD